MSCYRCRLINFEFYFNTCAHLLVCHWLNSSLRFDLPITVENPQIISNCLNSTNTISMLISRIIGRQAFKSFHRLTFLGGEIKQLFHYVLTSQLGNSPLYGNIELYVKWINDGSFCTDNIVAFAWRRQTGSMESEIFWTTSLKRILKYFYVGNILSWNRDGWLAALTLTFASATPSTASISPLPARSHLSHRCSGGGSVSDQKSRGKGTQAAS